MAHSHIRTTQEAGRVVLRLNDTELFDFVDDFLTEQCGLDYELTVGPEPNQHTIIFPSGTSMEIVDSALGQLDAKKIERIFRINNPSARAG